MDEKLPVKVSRIGKGEGDDEEGGDGGRDEGGGSGAEAEELTLHEAATAPGIFGTLYGNICSSFQDLSQLFKYF